MRRGEDRDLGRSGGLAIAGVYPSARPMGGVARAVLAGWLAGVPFLLFQVLALAQMGLPWETPLRRMASLLAGGVAVDPAFGLGAAVALGLLVLAVVLAVWGLVFAALTSALGIRNAHHLAYAGILFGFGVWAVHFFAVPALAGPWFRPLSPLAQFIAHTFGFGLPLGYALSALRSRASRG